VKPEIPDGRGDLSVFDQKRSVARHAGQGQVGRIDGADLPENRLQDAQFG
jgi:hypothetical protein